MQLKSLLSLIIFVILCILWGCFNQDIEENSVGDKSPGVIQNKYWEVYLSNDYPWITGAQLKEINESYPAILSDEPPLLFLNDQPKPIDLRQLKFDLKMISALEAEYIVSLPQSGTLMFKFILKDRELCFELAVNDTSANPIRQIDFSQLPFISLKGNNWSYYREVWKCESWDSLEKGLWQRLRRDIQRIGDGMPETSPEVSIYVGAWRKEGCLAMYSDYPIHPLRTRLRQGDSLPKRASYISMGLGEYNWRLKTGTAPKLTLRIAWLPDLNGDGMPNEHDYFLWVNRQLPQPPQWLKETIWYKIFCGSPGDGVVTTFEQCLEIIKGIYHLTDGLPQLIYLVGWQYNGHDTGYPSLDKVNPAIGGQEGLLKLVEEAKKYNAVISYHINVDDAYPESPGWDESIMSLSPDTHKPYPWQVFFNRQSFHISHTKDVLSGKIFKRLDAMRKLVPMERSIHVDAFRSTNLSWEANGEFISQADELFCGVMPILRYFRERGIEPTCESIDSQAIIPSGIMNATWHMDSLRFYHGKLLGGGRGEDFLVRGIGASINTDLTWPMWQKERGRITDMIYLGSLLYFTYVQEELFKAEENNGNWVLQFGKRGKTEIDSENSRLKVTWDGIEIARDNERFIPWKDKEIYLYSQQGGMNKWILPENWRNVNLEAYTLTPEGKILYKNIKIQGNEITIDLPKQTPVKLRLK